MPIRKLFITLYAAAVLALLSTPAMTQESPGPGRNTFRSLLYAVSVDQTKWIPLATLDSYSACGLKIPEYIMAGWDLFCQRSNVLSSSLAPPSRTNLMTGSPERSKQ